MSVLVDGPALAALLCGALVLHIFESLQLGGKVSYPNGAGKCDLMMANETTVQAKMIRHWRVNGDPELSMYGHLVSPFHRNTLLTDARRLQEAVFGERSGLLRQFYTRIDDDLKTVEALPERYMAADLAKKAVLISTIGTKLRRTCAE